MLGDDVIITWKGFRARRLDLLQQGWNEYSKHSWKRTEQGNLIHHIGDHYYLRHPDHFMLGRFFVPRNSEKTEYELDFMINLKQHQRRLIKNRAEYNFGKEDIAELLEVILQLQKEYPKPQQRLANADIIFLKQRSR